jgi:hypothetical protein
MRKFITLLVALVALLTTVGPAPAQMVPQALQGQMTARKWTPYVKMGRDSWFVASWTFDGRSYYQGNANSNHSGYYTWVLQRSSDKRTWRMEDRPGMSFFGDNATVVNRAEWVSLTADAYDTPIWMMMDVMVEPGTRMDSTFNAFFQAKNTADASDTIGPAPLTFNVFDTAGGAARFEIGTRTIPAKGVGDPLLTLTADDPGQTIRSTTPAFVPGIWYRVVSKTVWNYTAGGSHEVWIDGTKVVNYSGATGYNDASGPHCQFGLYRGNTPARAAVQIRNYRCGTTDLTAFIGPPVGP